MSNKQQLQTTISRGQFLVFLTIVSLLPWMRGGEVHWHYNLFEVVLFMLFATCIATNSEWSNNKPWLKTLAPIKIPLLFLVLFNLYFLVQLIPLPLEVIKTLSPATSHIYQNANLLLGIDSANAPLSLAQDITSKEAIKQASYLVVFLLTMLLVNSHKRLIVITWVIVVVTLSTAVYAMINYYTQGGFLYLPSLPPWHEHDHTSINGPLSYKNHYASYLIMTIPLGVGLLWYYQQQLRTTTQSLAKPILLRHGRALTIVLFLIIALLVIVLLFNASRAGLLALCFSSLITLFTIRKLFWPKRNIKHLIGLSALFALLITFVALTGIGDRIVNKIQTNGDNGRGSLINTALSISNDFTYFGTGAGTYPSIQTGYKDKNLHGKEMWQHVHNDFLELLTTHGLVGLALLTIAIGLLFLKMFFTLRNKSGPLFTLQAGYFCAALGLLLHAFADFNFQLPLTAVSFYVVIALCLKAHFIDDIKAGPAAQCQ